MSKPKRLCGFYVKIYDNGFVDMDSVHAKGHEAALAGLLASMISGEVANAALNDLSKKANTTLKRKSLKKIVKLFTDIQNAMAQSLEQEVLDDEFPLVPADEAFDDILGRKRKK